jgi:hypothetical protein
MIDSHDVLAIVRPIDQTLQVESARVELREARIPYGEAVLVCTLPGAEDRADIDLRTGDLTLDLRLRRDFGRPWSLADLGAAGGNSVAGIGALLDGGNLGTLANLFYRPWNSGQVIGSQRRDLSLLVTRREYDDTARTLTLTAHTLDALLLGDALLDTEPLDPETTDLRTICAGVLTRYGATLTPGDTTATVTEAAATIWQPGDTAFDYLTPMLEAASLRLWCDDSGAWQLTARQSTSPGAASLSATSNMTEHRDVMTRVDTEVWWDAVAIRYQWTDDLGVTQTEYDNAGPTPATATLTLTRNTPYPGAGAADGILARAAGRGRVLNIEAVSNYTHAPGQPVTITAPDTPAQTGYIAAVLWRIPEGEAIVTTRGLVDTPDTAWLFLEAGESWLDSPVSESWLAETIGA